MPIAGAEQLAAAIRGTRVVTGATVARTVIGLAWLITMSCLPASVIHAQRAGRIDAELSPQVEIDLIDATVRSQFDHVRELVAQEQWDDAMGVLSRLAELEPARLVAATGIPGTTAGTAAGPAGRADRFTRYVPVRHYCYQKMGEIGLASPAALAQYRLGVDTLVQRWLDESGTPTPEAVLRRIVERYFLSSHTDQVLLQWGDCLLERGDFPGARHAWEQVSPHFRSGGVTVSAERVPPGLPWWLILRRAGRDGWWTSSTKPSPEWAVWEPLLQQAAAKSSHLVYPDSKIDLAAIRARMVLASVLEGATERAGIEWAILARLHPDAQGQLSGQQGRWVDLLSSFMEAHQAGAPLRSSQQWPTFAQTAARSPASAAASGPPNRRLWTVDFPAITQRNNETGSGRPRVAESNDALLSYHPIVVGDRVFVADQRGVHAFQLRSGAPVWPTNGDSALVHAADLIRERGRAPRSVGVPRFTLHADDERLLAKIYARVTDASDRDEAIERPIPGDSDDAGSPISVTTRIGAERSYVIGLDLSAEGRVLQRWQLKPPDFTAEWTVDGTPVSDGSRIFVSLRRQDAVRTQSYVACFEWESGELLWRRFVAAAESPRGQKGYEVGHHLLTLDQGCLYFNSNLGAVAAIQASDGELLWLCRYPRSDYVVGDPDRADRFLYRDLNPCLLHCGNLVVAPADSDRIFALDAATGELLWSTDGEHATDVIHLLGVAGDRLIASGDYLYWFDAQTGQMLSQFPAARKEAAGFALPSPRGFGRGLLVGDDVWFPTRDKILVFRQQLTPERRTAENRTRPGPVFIREIDLSRWNATGGNLIVARGVLLIAGPRALYALAVDPP